MPLSRRSARRPRILGFGALVVVALMATAALIGGSPSTPREASVDFVKKSSRAGFCDRHPDHWKCGGLKPGSDTDSAPVTEPSEEPSAQPSEEPTSEPTTEPTTEPTAEPTTEPTAEPTSEPTTEPAPSTCTDPVFVTSDSNGMWNDGGYIVHNNMWNISGYDVSETLSACSYDSWSVTATADNRSGDGAVKTYPNVHKDYHDWGTGEEPLLSSFSTIESTFAATSPQVGIYNVAYDIWLNGVPGEHEVMIWTENHNQVPAGSRIASGVSLSGYTWDVYATSSNGYIAFVPSQPMTQGSLDLKAMLDWLTAQGRIDSNATLGQICFGVEVVSTDGQPATFEVTDFSITDG